MIADPALPGNNSDAAVIDLVTNSSDFSDTDEGPVPEQPPLVNEIDEAVPKLTQYVTRTLSMTSPPRTRSARGLARSPTLIEPSEESSAGSSQLTRRPPASFSFAVDEDLTDVWK